MTTSQHVLAGGPRAMRVGTRVPSLACVLGCLAQLVALCSAPPPQDAACYLEVRARRRPGLSACRRDRTCTDTRAPAACVRTLQCLALRPDARPRVARRLRTGTELSAGAPRTRTSFSTQLPMYRPRCPGAARRARRAVLLGRSRPGASPRRPPARRPRFAEGR